MKLNVSITCHAHEIHRKSKDGQPSPPKPMISFTTAVGQMDGDLEIV
jgi:hypothetical protein